MAGKSPEQLAADLIRVVSAYREMLERDLPAYEDAVQEATETLQERRSLHAAGQLSAAYVEHAEWRLQAARRSLTNARAALDSAHRILAEAMVQDNVARLAPLPRGAYEDTGVLVRFNGRAKWSLLDVPRLEQPFAKVFGRRLPISSYGQTSLHDQLGLDHRHAVDVAVHPDSAEGQWLLRHLRQDGIPFIAVRAALPGSATGAHVHIGLPSLRLKPVR